MDIVREEYRYCQRKINCGQDEAAVAPGLTRFNQQKDWYKHTEHIYHRIREYAESEGTHKILQRPILKTFTRHARYTDNRQILRDLTWTPHCSQQANPTLPSPLEAHRRVCLGLPQGWSWEYPRRTLFGAPLLASSLWTLLQVFIWACII